MRSRYQFVVARMNLQIVNRHGRQAGHELLPRNAAVQRHERADVGSQEEQIRILEVFANHVHEVRATARKRGRQACERGAEIARDEGIRHEISTPMIIERDVEGGRVEV